MTAPTVIRLIDPTLVLADTQAGLTTGTAYECQLTAATLTPTAVTTQIPATGCAPASNVPSKSTWSAVLAWLQDWTDAGGGLSNYAIEHETELVWFKFVLDNAGNPTVAAEGQIYVQASQYGGTFGGPPALATATWPLLGAPTFTVPALTAAAASVDVDAAPADADTATV